MALSLPIITVDAFSKRHFCGNPAAVCPLEGNSFARAANLSLNQSYGIRSETPAAVSLPSAPLSDDLQQRIAFELNLSETAFVKPLNGSTLTNGERFGLRWFTPTTEVSLCGHATLATAHVLINELHNDRSTLHFDTLSGVLSCSRAPDGRIAITLPQYDVFDIGTDVRAQPPTFLDDLINATIGNLKVLNVAYAPLAKYLLLHLDCTKDQLESMSPDLARMKTFDSNGCFVRGVAVAVDGRTVGYEGFDFASRMFAPWLGIDEDPACGTAHCVMGPYFSKRSCKKSLRAYQYFPSRGAEFSMDLLENGQIRLTGDAVTVIKGTINLPT